MSAYNQSKRRVGVLTPLGENAFLLNSSDGTKTLSGLYSYALQLVSEDDSIEANSLVSHPTSFWVEELDSEKRFFH